MSYPFVRHLQYWEYTYPIAPNTEIQYGETVGLNADGKLVPVALSNKAIGIASESVPIGQAIKAKVFMGLVERKNGTGADEITLADIDTATECFAVDKQTAGKTNGGGTYKLIGKPMALAENGNVIVEVRK